MVNLIKILATIGAVIAAVVALVALSIGNYILSGTFFTFVAFGIYIREISK